MTAIFFICSIFFESLRTAALLLLLIPLSFIGIFLIFYWVDAPFDQGGYVSFLLLSGIVVNALILIMAEYHQLLRAYPWRKRIDLFHRAFRMKSTPIFLTIISTTLGLIPFLLHGQDEVFWYSLALGAIGGLLFSIIVIVLIVPLFIGISKK
jgi:multidrug efflux pump subunit AcrB